MNKYLFTIKYSANSAAMCRKNIEARDYKECGPRNMFVCTKDDKINIIDNDFEKQITGTLSNKWLSKDNSDLIKNGRKFIKGYYLNNFGKFVIYNDIVEYTVWGCSRPIRETYLGYLTKIN